MNKSKKRISTNFKIVAATLTTIFSLSSVFTGTYAWFMMTKSATISTGSFTVTAGEGIEFDLYYLHHFDTEPNRSGNYNLDTHLFAGYEINYDNPVFSQVHYNSSTGEIIDDPDPTNINHLWPAHKVTYAIVVTSGTLSQFTLESWDEVVSEASKIKLNDEDVNISLSWATDIYGGAYYVTKTANVLDDLATGFTSYKADTTLEDKLANLTTKCNTKFIFKHLVR